MSNGERFSAIANLFEQQAEINKQLQLQIQELEQRIEELEKK